MVLDVDVFCHVRGHGVVSKLDCVLIVLIECSRSTVLALVDILHQLPKVYSALSCATYIDILCLCGGQGHHLLLLGGLADCQSVISMSA
jgi:hypothetical protein